MMKSSTKPTLMHLLTTSEMGGAERLALSILDKNRDKFNPIIANMFETDGDLALCAKSMHIPSLALNSKDGKIKTIINLYKLLRKNKVSLLHVQAGYLLLYAFPAAKLAGIPIVYTEHALHSIKKYSNIRRGIKLFSPFIRAISCVNEEIQEYFIKQLNISPKKVCIIENGVDTNNFSAQGEKANLPWQNANPDELFVFGTVARLSEAKDHPNLIHAFALLAEKYSQARLLMVGDGEEREATEKLIQSLDLNNKIFITGKALNIPERLRSMQVFVMSSQREGLPVAILEAMACGLPVVSTNVGGIASLDDNGTRLNLVPPRNPEALSKAMEELLTNSEKREFLAKQGQEYILAEKSDLTMAKKYFSLYNCGDLSCH